MSEKLNRVRKLYEEKRKDKYLWRKEELNELLDVTNPYNEMFEGLYNLWFSNEGILYWKGELIKELVKGFNEYYKKYWFDTLSDYIKENDLQKNYFIKIFVKNNIDNIELSDSKKKELQDILNENYTAR